MTKIFISYSSKDRTIVDELAADLDLLLDDVTFWYDRELNRKGGQQWWNLILEQIRACDVFIYALSPHVLKSEPCRREYSYAQALAKPILPLVIAEIEIRYLPVELQAAQLVNFQTRDRQQQKSLKASILNLPPAPSLPPNAKELAPAAPLDPAGVLFDRIAQLTNDSDQQVLVLTAIGDLHEEADYREFVPELLNRLLERDDVLTGRNMKRAQALQARLVGLPIDSAHMIAKTASPINRRPASINLFPAPFAWIDIPGTIGKKLAGEPYRIAKYPITNAQFATFINANGYHQQKWWTAEGWLHREQNKWTEPHYWTEKTFNGTQHPVVGISWFEAVAFCLWLSEVIEEKIILPTENQWQYAAQGDDDRVYPWGNIWECTRCNNSVKPCTSIGTTPVQLYEGKGDSPFGVVDMAGNIYEWCLTDYETGENELTKAEKSCVLRGGSWVLNVEDGFSCFYRGRNAPNRRGSKIGFRLACL